MMAFKDWLKGELIDIVQWIDDTSNTMVYRFDRRNNEIKGGAKLVVREGQAAVFVNEGKLADVFGPGTYTLDTKNMPILSTILGWKYGFESPFKAEVYFVSTRVFTDLKWGTLNPIMMRDPEFGPVRIRAFGTYTTRVSDPGTFIKNVVGTDGRFTTEEIIGQLRNLIVASFTEGIAQTRVSVLDMASRQGDVAGLLQGKIKTDFARYGLDLPTLLIENISMPAEVEAALDKRTSMGVLGNLDAYTKMQAADAMRDAAKNPGTAGTFVGVGVGQNMGGMIGANLSQAHAAGTAPPPMAPASAGTQFFLGINGQQQGPFDAASIAAMAARGQVNAQTLVWTQGMANWQPASQVTAVATILGSVPPPMPAQ
ncbi:MAG: SPFH domain-containing protein [Phycisphaerales bacterium]|nr:SPFH domain-containing protein [Phycisphaerales bacterium]